MVPRVNNENDVWDCGNDVTQLWSCLIACEKKTIKSVAENQRSWRNKTIYFTDC